MRHRTEREGRREIRTEIESRVYRRVRGEEGREGKGRRFEFEKHSR